MTQQNAQTKNKGGRPPKAVKKDQLLAVKCSLFERRTIEALAKSANFTVSEYLREIGMTGKIDRREKSLPPDVLEMKGTLNHLAANFNQIAKKRNSNEELTVLERADLKVWMKEIKDLVTCIKTHYQ
ncbi:mobilization protein [uncultured Chitinophaga sp.]|jgi:hypothetical protein|uniref:plasmid mobilization protein n=1 Tax=uncultured Chitinophaga sp. TaxID=339340 RepID=UPI002612E06D|nr:mobilization protein [uncultured Chitinophaga sp.]